MNVMQKALPGIFLVAALGLNVAVAQEAREPALASFANGEIITGKELNQYLGRRIDLKAAARNAAGVEAAVQEMALARALGLEGDSLGVARRSGLGEGRFDDIYAHAIYTRLSPVCEQPKDEAATRDLRKNPQGLHGSHLRALEPHHAAWRREGGWRAGRGLVAESGAGHWHRSS